ncbi:MAG: hypothetical protein ABI200_07245 [Gaiellales bacterium]
MSHTRPAPHIGIGRPRARSKDDTYMNCSAMAPLGINQAATQMPPSATNTQAAPTLPTTGGGGQAAVGVAELAPILAKITDAISRLQAALTSHVAGASGGGPAGAGASAICPHVNMPPALTTAPPIKSDSKGANGAPEAKGAKSKGAPGKGAPSKSGGGGKVDPSSVKDKTSIGGLTSTSKRGLQEAHKYGLPLVSGKRGGSGTSDHIHGNAIDVGTLPIGAKSSSGGTPKMKEFAEHMREQGKAGKLNVKYVIADGRIASANDNWSWRPYTYPGKSASSLAALKQSNQGEFNRIQHYDHVHVSFK